MLAGANRASIPRLDSELITILPLELCGFDIRNRSRPYAASTRSETFSPIMMQGALVLPLTIVGMIEASATRSPAIP